ncbi:MAG: DMT family transporter, partial [Pseudomonadota bacterium]
MSASQWLWLAALSVLWGGSFFFTGYAVREIDAVTLVFFRVALAALVLLPVVYARGSSLPILGAAWIPFAVMAILNNVIPFTSMALGQARIESGLASVINATTPVWSVLLLHLFTADEKLTWNKFIGVLLGAGGVAILIGPAAFGGLNAQLTGILFLLITTGSYGCAAVWGRRLRGIPPVVTAASQLTAS